MSHRHSFQADFTIAGFALLALVGLMVVASLGLGFIQIGSTAEHAAPLPSAEAVVINGTTCRHTAPHSLGECTGNKQGLDQ